MQILALGFRLATVVLGVQFEGLGCGSRVTMDIGWPTELLMFVARRILANQLRP